MPVILCLKVKPFPERIVESGQPQADLRIRHRAAGTHAGRIAIRPAAVYRAMAKMERIQPPI
jgi:hypothetical protein